MIKKPTSKKPKTKLKHWTVAFLLLVLFVFGALGYLDPIKYILASEALTFQAGTFSVSAYKLLKVIFALLVLLWMTNIILTTGEKYLGQLQDVKPSNRSLLIKGFQILVYTLIFLIGLDILGIDLTALAVLGGAIGIGIGFGLQKITSNFISGIILLFEKSVQEGDFVEVNESANGFVRHTGARYTLLETLDSKEVMVPNEDFITNCVTNWTYSNRQGRIEINIGVSYESDIEKARELILEAAKEHEKCSQAPLPKCYLEEFADSSVNFLLHFWIDDVTEGRLQLKSDVMRSIWKKFKENNITIPFPQQDVYIKNTELFNNNNAIQK